jgi:hypothetical protein
LSVRHTSDLRADLHLAVTLLASDPRLLRVADALTVWLEGETITIEGALGLANTWRRSARRRRRDDAYFEIARKFPHLCGRALVRAVDGVVRNSEPGTWRHEILEHEALRAVLVKMGALNTSKQVV